MAVVILGSILCLSMGRAQTDSGFTPRELKELLEELGKFRKSLNARYEAQHNIALKAYQAAAASDVKAYDFFLECTKEMRFKREDKREEAWRTWREQNLEWLRSQEHMKARRLQLQYLILTIKAAQADDIQPLVTPVLQLLKEMATIDAQGHRYLRESVSECVFAETYELSNTLDSSAWEMTPLNIDGVFEKTVLPLYRNPGDVNLIRAWEQRIDLQVQIHEQRKKAQERAEREQAREGTDPRRRPEARQERYDYLAFDEDILPELKWSMASELIDYAFLKLGVEGMITVLKTYPGHKNARDWLVEVTKIVQEKLGELEPSEGATAAAGSGS
ncbi:MAG TPA: hypothetical protein VMN36_10050 [Verrucomicrobiales bacterium]|nr:hypothetical protein [Verrucomicrobiales bacterium]